MDKTSVEQLVFLSGVFAGSFALLLFVRALVLKGLGIWSIKRPSGPALVIRHCIRFPSIFWAISGAGAIAISVSDFSDKASVRLGSASECLFIFAVTWAIANVCVGMVKRALGRISSPMADSGLIFGLIRGSIFCVGILIIFAELKIQIAPILTALGVAGLAVALALKDTLENLFSGVHLLIDRAVVVGDTVRIETGQEGVIQDIGWRTTRIRLLDSQMLIIPNVKFAQGIIVRKRP